MPETACQGWGKVDRTELYLSDDGVFEIDGMVKNGGSGGRRCCGVRRSIGESIGRNGILRMLRKWIFGGDKVNCNLDCNGSGCS